MDATDAGRPILLALRGLADAVGRKRLRRSDIMEDVVTGSWRRFVFTGPETPAETVDHRAYALCVLDALHRALRRRDVFAIGSTRWADPRASLLEGAAWQQARPQVLTALRLTDPVESHLTAIAGRLDAAYTGMAGRLGPHPGTEHRTRHCGWNRTGTVGCGCTSRGWRPSRSQPVS